MVLNVHPLFVHFPIALLTTYAILECLHFKALLKLHWWFPAKAVMLILGTIGGFVAFQSGSMAQQAYRGSPLRSLIHTHQNYAGITLWIFSILSLVYIISTLFKTNKLPQALLKLGEVNERLVRSWFIVLPALAGLIAVIITGALGGAIVYGTNADPIVTFITHLLGF